MVEFAHAKTELETVKTNLSDSIRLRDAQEVQNQHNLEEIERLRLDKEQAEYEIAVINDAALEKQNMLTTENRQLKEEQS